MTNAHSTSKRKPRTTDEVGLTAEPSTSHVLHSSVVDEMADHIRVLISDGGLRVGDSLPTEKELNERFSAGRNTVREAMRILKTCGVVKVRQKIDEVSIGERMTHALDIFSFNTLEVYRETVIGIQGLRSLLEVASFELLYDRIKPDDIGDLHCINNELLTEKTVADASEVEFWFHTRLIEVLGNKAILDIYKIMKPVILKNMANAETRQIFSTVTYSEHANIFQMFEAGGGQPTSTR